MSLCTKEVMEISNRMVKHLALKKRHMRSSVPFVAAIGKIIGRATLSGGGGGRQRFFHVKAGWQRPNHIDFLHIEFQNVDVLAENLLQIRLRSSEISVNKLFNISPSLGFESDAKVVVVDQLGREDRVNAARSDGQRPTV